MEWKVLGTTHRVRPCVCVREKKKCEERKGGESERISWRGLLSPPSLHASPSLPSTSHPAWLFDLLHSQETGRPQGTSLHSLSPLDSKRRCYCPPLPLPKVSCRPQQLKKGTAREQQLQMHECFTILVHWVDRQLLKWVGRSKVSKNIWVCKTNYPRRRQVPKLVTK